MAKVDPQSDSSITSQSPIARAEATRYIEQQKAADFNKNLSQYMFWGATTLMAATVGLAIGFVTLPAGIAALGTGVTIGGAIASVGTFVGSVFFSRKATEIGERSNVLYSDIDSRNQAHRMVQEFARAQAPALGDVANDNPGSSWANRVGGSVARSGNWQDRVVAQADREDAVAMQNLR